MEIVKENMRRTLHPFPALTLHEYDMHESAIGGGVAELNGRYPENGFVTNEKTKELVYILSGTGKLLRPEAEISLSAGDMVLINAGDVYAWTGTMSLYLANTPRFDPAQHKAVANKKS
jgi:hypothetical protein